MYQSKQAKDLKENPSLLPAVGEAPRPAFLHPSNPSPSFSRPLHVNSTASTIAPRYCSAQPPRNSYQTLGDWTAQFTSCSYKSSL
jgi:hypothetical protein